MFAFIPKPMPLRVDPGVKDAGVIVRLSLLVCVLFCFGSNAHAVDYVFRADVDRDSLTVGDPFHLILTLELPEDASPEVIPEIALPEAFRVLDAPNARLEQAGQGRRRWVQRIRLATFRPGETSISDLGLKVIPVSGDTIDLSDDPISLLIQSVKPDSLRDIIDVKAPVPIEAVVPVWVWLALVLLILLVVGLVLRKRRRREKQGSEPEVVVVDWFEAVRALMASDLIPNRAFDAYYTRLSEALRRYIEQSVGVDAMERTTHEIRGDLTDAGVAEVHVLGIEGFLTEADLVKFAKSEPSAEQARADGDRALALMKAIRPERDPATVDEVVAG